MTRRTCPSCGSEVELPLNGFPWHCPQCGASLPPQRGETAHEAVPPLPRDLEAGRQGRLSLLVGLAVFVPVLGLLASPVAIAMGALGLRARGAWRLMGAGGMALAILGIMVHLDLVRLRPHPRELANRAVCAANLRGLGQAIAMYSEENRTQSPHIKPTNSRWGTTWDAPARTVSSLDALAAQANDEGVNIQHWWLLVHTGQVSAGQFRCPAGRPTEIEVDAVNRFGFSSWSNVSYALPRQTRHEGNRAFVGAPGQSGFVVWAADLTSHVPGATPNHHAGANYLSANYSVVRFHRGRSFNLGYEEDDIFTPNPDLGANDSYLIWRAQR